MAEWKQIQKRTFTRWCNEHLKQQDTKIEDLETDFSDGIPLIILMEVLSEKMVGRYNKKPRIHAQQMENVQLALEFIEKQNIHLVNIGGGDIVNGNLKLILGLVWTLILHYQISMGFDTTDAGKKAGPSPKQALLEWLQRKLPEKNITNFTKDWNDGTLIAALVDAMAPGLCPEHHSMDPRNALENATHAMQLAEDWLDVPQVLGPEDMVNHHVDELSMMTYLSKYPTCKLKDGAAIPGKAKVYGPGVELNTLDTDMHSADFVVDTRAIGVVGHVDATCIGPKGQVEVFIRDNGDGTYQCSYELRYAGKYIVTVNYNETPAGQSPYTVNVATGASIPKPDQVRAYGPGLQWAYVQQYARFTVDSSKAGSGYVTVDIDGPGEYELDYVDNGNGTYLNSYTVTQAGIYIINIKFADQHILGSPYRVEAINNLELATRDSQIELNRDVVKWFAERFAQFSLDALNTSKGEVLVNCDFNVWDGDISVQSDGKTVCHVEPTERWFCKLDCIYTAKIRPHITFEAGSLDGLIIRPPNIQKPDRVIAYGPGLERAVMYQSTTFTVDASNAGYGVIDVKIRGPVECEITSINNGDGTFYCMYTALRAGIYYIDIKFADEHIPGSPFQARCERLPPDASKCVIAGLDNPGWFTVDCKSAGGRGLLEVGVAGSYLPCEDISVVHDGNYVFDVTYDIREAGKTTISVLWHGKHMIGSPFTVVTTIEKTPDGKQERYHTIFEMQ